MTMTATIATNYVFRAKQKARGVFASMRAVAAVAMVFVLALTLASGAAAAGEVQLSASGEITGVALARE